MGVDGAGAGRTAAVNIIRSHGSGAQFMEVSIAGSVGGFLRLETRIGNSCDILMRGTREVAHCVPKYGGNGFGRSSGC